jgi:hypothetical protein
MFFYYTGNTSKQETVNEELEKLASDDEPDTRLGQGTLSFNEAPEIHSQAGAHISKISIYTLIAEVTYFMFPISSSSIAFSLDLSLDILMMNFFFYKGDYILTL